MFNIFLSYVYFYSFLFLLYKNNIFSVHHFPLGNSGSHGIGFTTESKQNSAPYNPSAPYKPPIPHNPSAPYNPSASYNPSAPYNPYSPSAPSVNLPKSTVPLQSHGIYFYFYF